MFYLSVFHIYPKIFGTLWLAATNHSGVKNAPFRECIFIKSNLNGCRQLLVDGVSGILDGNRTAVPQVGNHRNRFAAVTTQGEQERIQFLIIGHDLPDDILFSFLCVRQIHGAPPFKQQLVSSNLRYYTTASNICQTLFCDSEPIFSSPSIPFLNLCNHTIAKFPQPAYNKKIFGKGVSP